MKNINGVNYLKIGEVSKILDRSAQTIKIWYEYAAHNKEVELPEFRTDLDAACSRYWREEDVLKLSEFQETIQRGMMTSVTAKKWGKRGDNVKHYGLDRFEEKESEN